MKPNVWAKTYHMMSDKDVFGGKEIKVRWGLFKVIKASIHCKDWIISNVYTSNNIALKFIEQKLQELQAE